MRSSNFYIVDRSINSPLISREHRIWTSRVWLIFTGSMVMLCMPKVITMAPCNSSWKPSGIYSRATSFVKWVVHRIRSRPFSDHLVPRISSWMHSAFITLRLICKSCTH